MAIHVTKISLDFHAEAPKQRIVTAKQYDRGDEGKARVIEISLFSNGVSYEIPEDGTVRIRMQKPDGHYIYNYCEVVDNKAIAILTSQTLAVVGTVWCDVEVDVENEIVSTVSFTMEIYPSPYDDDAVESSNEMNAVDQKFSDFQDYVNDTKDYYTQVDTDIKNYLDESKKEYTEYFTEVSNTTEEYRDDAKKWAEMSQDAHDVHIATYDRAGIVQIDPNTMKIDEYGVLQALGAVADESTIILYEGFRSRETVFEEDGNITETDEDGYVRKTIFGDDGNITEYLYRPDGSLIRTKTTTFNADGSISDKAVIPSDETTEE